MLEKYPILKGIYQEPNFLYSIMRGVVKIKDFSTIYSLIKKKDLNILLAEIQDEINLIYEDTKDIVSSCPKVSVYICKEEKIGYTFFIAASECMANLYITLQNIKHLIPKESFYTIMGLLYGYDIISIQKFTNEFKKKE